MIKSTLINSIKKSKIIISTHSLVYGAPQALREYLINNEINKLLFIAHPLYVDQNLSFFEDIRYGMVKCRVISRYRTKISIINYLIELFLTLIWVVGSREKFDLFVGVDNLNTLAGLILKHFGRVRKVIYYTIDYSPIRFKNKLLNYIYHKIDSLCVRYADIVWNVSPRIAKGRKKLFGINYYDKQKLVPIGVWTKKIKHIPFGQVKKHQMLFLGNLIEKQGVQIVLYAIPDILKKIPDFHFLIIGGGEYKKELERIVDRLKIKNYVTFTGWIKDREGLDKMLSESACAIAPYNPDKADFTYYADPTKIKDYLSAGLPVILTDTSHNAREMEQEKCGVLINYHKEDIIKAVIDLMRNNNKLKLYRDNSIKYIRQYNWNLIFTYNLKDVL